jgi:hypothetical protein
MASPLEKEFLFYLENHSRLLSTYRGKYVLIRDERILGAFDSEMDAIKAGVDKFPLGTFLVQRCEPGEESYTQTFHSSVVFEQQ